MRTISLLLLVAFSTLAEPSNVFNRHAKRELLVRSKRRWVLSTVKIREEDPGPFPKTVSQMFNDKTQNRDYKFQISGMGVTTEPMGVFSIDEKTGIVYSHKPVDRELYPIFHIDFNMIDKQTGESMDRPLSFNVEIEDINDNPPRFSPPRIRVDVSESMPGGSLPLSLLAMDKDEANTPNSEITITMVSQNPKEPKIAVEDNGDGVAQLTFEGCFDYDKIKKYEVIVQATDHGTPSLSSTAVLTLNIVDSNTHLPMFKKREYTGEILESTTKDDVLRIAVEDKDTPQTPAWHASYYFIKGNEQGHYKIETDPNTNEGILSVIKEQDFEKTPNDTLQIGVTNEEPLFVCGKKSTIPPPDSVCIKMNIININDPPAFEKVQAEVFQKEEEPAGKVLFTPKVQDPDSSKIKYVVLEDPAGWVSMDEKTGQVKSAKKMNRESPFVDENDNYKVVVAAIDDGDPPATGTSTIVVHLGDINDNTPQLVNKSLMLCGNKVDMVMVAAKDLDSNPYSGPFTFSLGADDKTVEQRWKLNPANGEEGGLISLKTLPYGNYSVPLVIQDQQNFAAHHTLEVIVCDCGKEDVCVPVVAPSASLGAPGIGLIFAGILLFLLLILVFMCDHGKLNHMPMLSEEGSQTLIKYNEEGGASECKAEPSSFLTPPTSVTVTQQQQVSQMAPIEIENAGGYTSAGFTMMNSNMTSLGTQHQSDTLRSVRGQCMGGSSNYSRSFSLLGNSHLSAQISRRLHKIDGNHLDSPVYRPKEYAYEGKGSISQSLDRLSLCDAEDDLKFPNYLGPRFKTLGGICQQAIQEKNIHL